MATDREQDDALSVFRQFLALERDVLVPLAGRPAVGVRLATAVGLFGTGYFLLFGKELLAYRYC